MSAPTVLDEILAHKREELEARRATVPLAELQARAAEASPVRSFRRALEGNGDVRIIAEVKRRSPSKGVLAVEGGHGDDQDGRGATEGGDGDQPRQWTTRLAALYADYGAAAISVLTDERYFGGTPEDLGAVRREAALPVLRKDFVLSGYQVVESRALGADAVLLIVAALDPDTLSDLLDEARLLGMDALVEIHTEEELGVALDAGAPLIGLNNRDLRTFQTSFETTRRLAPLVPDGHVVVSESGIREREQVIELARLGVHAALVGEALIASRDPGARLLELLGR